MSAAIPADARMTFGGALRSEWIKLASLRSTVWCYVILVALTLGLGVLIAATLAANDAIGAGPGELQAAWLQAATLGVGFAQLVVAVLGALVITGEFGTGMIRSTFAAVPRRVLALTAKAVVFTVATFVVSLAALVATALATAPILAGTGDLDLADGAVWLGLVGAAGYLALVGLFALGLGTIIRASAGAIATVLGVLLVLPTVLQILAGVTQAEWAANAAQFLPSSAGARLYAYPVEAVPLPPEVFQPIVLEPWQGLLVLLGWVALALIPGAVLLSRRDA